MRLLFMCFALIASSIFASTLDQKRTSLDLYSEIEHDYNTQSVRRTESPGETRFESIKGKEANERKADVERNLGYKLCCFEGKCREPSKWLSSQNTGMRCMCDHLNTGRWVNCRRIEYTTNLPQEWTTETTWRTEPVRTTKQALTIEPWKECCFHGKCRQPGQWLNSVKIKCMCDLGNSGRWTKCKEIEKATQPPSLWKTTAPTECCIGNTCHGPGQWFSSKGRSCMCDPKKSGKWIHCQEEIETTTTRPSFCGKPCKDDTHCDGFCSNCDWKTKLCEPKKGNGNGVPGFNGGFGDDVDGFLRLQHGERLFMAVNEWNSVIFSRHVRQNWEYVDGHLKNKSLGDSHCLTYDHIERVKSNVRLSMRRCTEQHPAQWKVKIIKGRRFIQSLSNGLCIDVRRSSGDMATLATCRSSRADDQAFESSSFLP